jgi:PncC family amidohydrolase
MITLEEQVGAALLKAHRWLVLAESCTGGLVGHRITNVAGSSAYYLGSITAYANEAKQALLGVSQDTLNRFGAVSRETVIEMAAGARQVLAGLTRQEEVIGVSVSGIAGPGGGTPEKPVGLVWIGLSAAEGDYAWKIFHAGSRVENKEYAAEQALGLLLAFLQGKLPAESRDEAR